MKLCTYRKWWLYYDKGPFQKSDFFGPKTLLPLTNNSLAKVIPHPVMYSRCVHYLQIAFCSCNLSICERQVQITVKRLQRWADENGFRFSFEKCALRVLYTKLRYSTQPWYKNYECTRSSTQWAQILRCHIWLKIYIRSSYKETQNDIQENSEHTENFFAQVVGCRPDMCAANLWLDGSVSSWYGCIIYVSARQHSTQYTIWAWELPQLHITPAPSAVWVQWVAPRVPSSILKWSMRSQNSMLKWPSLCQWIVWEYVQEIVWKQAWSGLPSGPSVGQIMSHSVWFQDMPSNLQSFSDAVAPWDRSAVVCDLCLLK